MSITQCLRTSAQSAPSVCAVAAGLALTFVTGCMVEDQDEYAAFEPAIAAAHVHVLSQLELADGVEMTFSAEYASADRTGEPVLSITAVGPANAYPYLADFRSRGATSLEAFLAVAPAGTEVPAEIRAAHAREAALLARSTAVRTFDLDQAYTSLTANPSCASYNAFLNSISGWTTPSSTSTAGTTALTRPAGGNILAAVCNFYNPEDHAIDLKQAQFCSAVSGGIACDPVITLANGERADKAWLGATSQKIVWAIGMAGYPNTTAYLAIGGFVPQ